MNCRNTLQRATSCMEHSSENVHLLGERMAAATERISESMQENSQALAMLKHVVEKLQELVSTSNTTSESPHGTETARRVVNRMGSRSISIPNSPAIPSSSRFSHCPSRLIFIFWFIFFFFICHHFAGKASAIKG